MAFAIQVVMALLTLSGLAYLLLALWGARAFGRSGHAQSSFSPDVTILKPVKGIDPRMYAGFVSHCRQNYARTF